MPGGGTPSTPRKSTRKGSSIPLLKLYDGGRRDETLIALLLRNVRIPEIVLGDLEAQLAACHVGEMGLTSLARRYTVGRLATFMDMLLGYTERRVRDELLDIPDGNYFFEDFIDDDGFGSGPIRIAVTLRFAGDSMVADFAGTSSQVRSALNATMSFTKAAVAAGLRCVMPDDIPSNGGFYGPISVVAPEGTIVNPRRPAPRAARGLTGFRAFDTVMGALSQALPGRIPAAGEGGASMIAIGGTGTDSESLIFVDFVTGGWGARPSADGIEGTSPIPANLSNVPIEEVELKFPIQVRRYGFVPDTGGAGQYRGCLSIVREWAFLGNRGLLQIRSDRRWRLPYGLRGGNDGTPSANILNPGQANEELLATNVTREIVSGDVLRHVTAGGGGSGDPLARDPDLVAIEVRDGKFTAPYAKRQYGVVLEGESGVVDWKRTEEVRVSMSDSQTSVGEVGVVLDKTQASV